jgi:hypothetical protein
MDRQAESFQFLSHDIGGSMFLEGGLRMGVDIMAPFDHLGMEGSDAIDDGHGTIP